MNSVIAGTGKEFTFTFGLGISQLGDALIAQKSPILSLIGFFMSYGFAFLFFFLAWLARHTPVALPIGMVVYALDALVFLVAQDWFGLGFHVFALFLIQTGYVAYKRAVALLATATQASRRPSPRRRRTPEPSHRPGYRNPRDVLASPPA